MKDPQQKRVYAWENQWIDWRPKKRLTEAQARMWVRWACKLYGVKPPRVLFYKSEKGTSIYDPNTHQIKLRPRHMNIWVCLHESAHAITDCLLGDELEGHGTHWVGVFRALLDTALVESVKKAGIKSAPLGKIGPRTIRYHYSEARAKPRYKGR
jgi:hypothetical protein